MRWGDGNGQRDVGPFLNVLDGDGAVRKGSIGVKPRWINGSCVGCNKKRETRTQAGVIHTQSI